MSATNYRALARAAARRYGLDPNVFERQINQESGFRPDARSKAGALGIAQIMPSTARGWGVDPMDPHAALDAAAKHMADYVRKYGSYRNALIAYNAGPGAVGRKSLPAETQNYVSTILGGKGAKALPTGTVQSSAPFGKTAVMASGNRREVVKDAVIQALLQGGKNIMANVAANIAQAQDAIGQTTPSTSGSTTTPTARPSKGGSGRIMELFYDPLGGWKNGQSIGAIGGHSDHVHVGAPTARKDFLKGKARQFGLTITSEHGGEHVPGSLHYRNEAFDAAGSPQQMAAFANYIRTKYGLK